MLRLYVEDGATNFEEVLHYVLVLRLQVLILCVYKQLRLCLDHQSIHFLRRPQNSTFVNEMELVKYFYEVDF